jgi:alkaline phosphatase D
MSLPEPLPVSELPQKPARRRALFAAGDLLLAGAAASALPAIAQRSSVTAPLRVMHGFADQTGLTLWLQGSRADALEVEVRAGDDLAAPVVQTFAVPLEARTDFTESLAIGGLDPGVQYSYAVRSTRSKSTLARGRFRTQPLWQWRTEPPTVRIATGSCAYMNDFRFDRPGKSYGGGEEIFDSIAATAPDLMLWLGDNIYLREAEYTSRDAINRRYRFYRAHPAMQKLWTATQHVAIWDDHDFGPDNSDLSYPAAGWTREMFHRYWPLPFTPPSDGLYGKVLQGDVDIFMLDDRSYRDHPAYPSADKAMYGPKQMKWLKTALLYSRAPFKIVAGGSQFFNRASRSECWLRYEGECQDFLRFLEEARIPGVVFLSGDRHFTEHLSIKRAGLYPLNEFTISPLTSGPSSSYNDAERSNPDVVPGSLLNERNFAILTVSGPRAQRSLAIEVRDTRGQKKWEWTTTAAELAQGTPA